MPIFVPPLFLLGTVTPGLNKFAADSLGNNASVVGRLSACNTVGSILGTFLPTFVTIPAVGTFVTFPIFSGPLLASAMGEVAGRFETIADPDGKPRVDENLVTVEGGDYILTDDKAPVDGLPAPGPELVATRPVWGCGSIYKA